MPRLESVRSERDPMHQATTGPEQDFLTRWFRSKWNALDVKCLDVMRAGALNVACRFQI